MGITQLGSGITEFAIFGIMDHQKIGITKEKKNLVTTLKGGTTPTGNRLKRPRIVLKLRTRRNGNITLR